MISPRSLSAYLGREVDDFRWVKNMSDKELDDTLSDIRPAPIFNEPLNRAQKVGFILGVAYKQFVFHFEMGTGKTRLSLELLKWFIQNGFISRALILANSDTVVQGWQDEILRWNIELPFKILLGNSASKWDMLNSFNLGIAVATHTGFSVMVSELEYSGRGDKREYVPVPNLIQHMRGLFDAFVIDESTRVGNSRSLSFRVCRAVMEDAPIRFALAGRLFGRDPMPVWAQFYLVDQGASFGPTINLFRGAFFTAKQGYFGGMEYKFNKKMEPQFQKFLGHRSVYFGIDEVTDLPELTKIRRMCMFPADTEVYYRRCVDEILKSKGNYREVQNAFLRMRQISSGFVGVFDDEEGETTEIEFPDNPKLDLLIELLQDLPSGRKAIVFHEFKWSGLQIAKALKKAKIVFGQLNASTKDWDQVKAKFDKSDLDLLVVSWRKGGYGLNLQAANYMFFFESPVSSLDRDQCERRIWRQGQRNRCFIYDLLMKDSVDARIIQFHSTAANLFEALVKDPSLIEK
jgi:hypothetical protein